MSRFKHLHGDVYQDTETGRIFSERIEEEQKKNAPVFVGTIDPEKLGKSRG